MRWIRRHASEFAFFALIIAVLALTSEVVSRLSKASANLLLDSMGAFGTLLLGVAAMWGLTTWRKKAARDLASSFLHSTVGLIDALIAARHQATESYSVFAYLLDESIIFHAGTTEGIDKEQKQLTNKADRLKSLSREWETIFAETTSSLKIDIDAPVNSLRNRVDTLTRAILKVSSNISRFRTGFLQFGDAEKDEARREAQSFREGAEDFQGQMIIELQSIREALVPYLHL